MHSLRTYPRVLVALALLLGGGAACVVEDVNLEESEVYSCLSNEDCLTGWVCYIPEGTSGGLCMKDQPQIDCNDFDNDNYFFGKDCASINKPSDDCNDTVAAINPGAEETCNNTDDNCDEDRKVDEGLSQPCNFTAPKSSANGVCALTNPPPQQVCNAGVLTPASCIENCPGPTCLWGPNFRLDETLADCDTLDNDCDGEVDEGCPTCTPGGQCGDLCFGLVTDPALCPCIGTQVCEPAQVCENAEGEEVPYFGRDPEVCADSIDNDCDGQIDAADSDCQ